MSKAEAQRFVTRAESDAALADRVTGLGNDTAAVLALVHAEGFDCSAEEIKAAYLAAHGDKLAPAQLDAIAGGVDDFEIATIVGVSVGVAAPAAAAAAF